MKKTINLFLISGFCFLISACTSSPTQFYQLSSIDYDNKIIDTRKIMIGVDTIDIAGYIERPQIVTIKDGTELNVSEFHRWAEPLSHSIQRVMAENISNHLKNGMAKPLGIKSQTYDYIVLVELNKFDGKFGDKAQLDAWWSISRPNKPNSVVREHTSIKLPIGNSYNDLVMQQNKLLSQLSTDIVKKINRMK